MNSEVIAFQSYERLKSLAKTGSGIDLERARELALLKKDNNYKKIMGDEDASWRSFIAQPELQPLHLSKADRLVKIYNKYIFELGLEEIDIIGVDSNSLVRLSTVVDKQNVFDWLDKARNLSRSDLYREINYGHIDELECNHKFECQVICTCKKCGVKEKEHVEMKK